MHAVYYPDMMISLDVMAFNGDVRNNEVCGMLSLCCHWGALDEMKLDIPHGQPDPVAVEVWTADLLETNDLHLA